VLDVCWWLPLVADKSGSTHAQHEIREVRSAGFASFTIEGERALPFLPKESVIG
jgi:hypothetical protein